MEHKILYINCDNNNILHDKKFYEDRGYRIISVETPDDMSGLIKNTDFDIIILCCEFNSDDDLRICRDIRLDFDGPFLVVPLNFTPDLQTRLLESGVDDILAGLLSSDVILAHLKMLIRRRDYRMAGYPGGDNHDCIEIGGIKVNRLDRTACIDDVEIDLTTVEFEMLLYLVENANRIVSRDELYRELLNSEYDGLDRCIDLRISRLRKKLGDSARRPRLIKSIRFEGYFLAANSG